MCDFLPASVHEILNEVESSLGLPVLVLIGFCTVQFVIYHIMHVVCILKELCRKKPKKKVKKCGNKGPTLGDRIKAMICSMFAKKKPPPPKKCEKPKKPVCKKTCSSADIKQSQCNDEDNDFDDDFDDDDVDEFLALE